MSRARLSIREIDQIPNAVEQDGGVSVTVEEGRDPTAVRRILEELPEWFGDPDAVNGYEADAGDAEFTSHLALSDGEVTGAALSMSHFPETAALHLIAVRPAVRGRGVGRRLVEAVAASWHRRGATYLTVHTVGPSFTSAPYGGSCSSGRILMSR